MIRHFTASAAVIDPLDRALLVQHRKSGLWLYPGGHVEADEDPAQAAVREVREEVGIDIQIVAPRVFEHPAVGTVPNPVTILVMDVTDAAVGRHQHIDFVYAARPRTTVLRPQLDEVGGAAWFPLRDIPGLNTPAELPALLNAVAEHMRSSRPGSVADDTLVEIP